MGINKGEKFLQQDVFVDYEFEKVMFRCDRLTNKIYRKFYNEQEFSSEIPGSNNLFNEALCFGVEITENDYLIGKK